MMLLGNLTSCQILTKSLSKGYKNHSNDYTFITNEISVVYDNIEGEMKEGLSSYNDFVKRV